MKKLSIMSSNRGDVSIAVVAGAAVILLVLVSWVAYLLFFKPAPEEGITSQQAADRVGGTGYGQAFPGDTETLQSNFGSLGPGGWGSLNSYLESLNPNEWASLHSRFQSFGSGEWRNLQSYLNSLEPGEWEAVSSYFDSLGPNVWDTLQSHLTLDPNEWNAIQDYLDSLSPDELAVLQQCLESLSSDEWDSLQSCLESFNPEYCFEQFCSDYFDSLEPSTWNTLQSHLTLNPYQWDAIQDYLDSLTPAELEALQSCLELLTPAEWDILQSCLESSDPRSCFEQSCPVLGGVRDETKGWQTYQNEEYGFEINYPENWNSSSCLATTPENPGRKVQIYDGVSIGKSSNTITIGMTANYPFSPDPNMSGRLSGKKIDGLDAYEKIWRTGYCDETSCSSPFIILWTKTKYKGYFYAFVFDNATKIEGTYDQILSTFKFTD